MKYRRVLRFLVVAASAVSLSVAMTGCAASSERSIILDIASSLTPVQPALVSTLSEREHLTAMVTAEGTATLVRQITEGKAGDILLSADAESLAPLITANLVDGATVPLATNRLVLAVTAANTAQVKSLNDLTRAGVRSVRCAASVPCGKLAATVIRDNKLSYSPLTETQNVSQAVKLLTSGEADAGLVYATDVAASAGKLISIDDPRLLSATSVVTGVVLSSSTIKEGAHRALAFWASAEFASQWRSAGFGPLQK